MEVRFRVRVFQLLGLSHFQFQNKVFRVEVRSTMLRWWGTGLGIMVRVG